MISLYWIKFSYKPLKSRRNWAIRRREVRRVHKNDRGLGRCRLRGWSRLQNSRVLTKVSIDCVENCVLIVPLWHVAGNPWQAKFIQDCGDILVLEFNGSVRPADLRHEGGAVL